MYVLDGGLSDWLAQELPMEHGEVTYKHRNLPSEKYQFTSSELQFCKKDFVKARAAEMQKE